MENNSNSNIIKLNIGGKKYQTTKTTLLSRGENFFSALINNPNFDWGSKDEEGFYFVDRNGKYFESILDFLRTGELLIKSSFTYDQIIREAEFYCIDMSSALCPYREGMYLEPSDGSMIIIEIDPNQLQYVGVTGVVDANKLFFRKRCKIRHTLPHTIELEIPEFNLSLQIVSGDYENQSLNKSNNNNNNNNIINSNNNNNNLIPSIKILNSKVWDYCRELQWKSGLDPNCKFPLELNTMFGYSNANNRKKMKVWFVEDDSSGAIQMWQSDSLLSSWVNTKVFNDQLIMYHNRSNPLGLIKISGKVIFLITGTTEETFSVYALRRLPPDQQNNNNNNNNND